MKKRKKLQASFVITLAAGAAAGTAALGAAGCMGQVITNPPLVECPAEEPVAGATCDGDLACTYDTGNPCGDVAEYTCVDGLWQTEPSVTCNPPPLTCPDTVPFEGDACEFGYGQCDYPDECGLTITATCGDDSKWHVIYPGSCNPPPPCEVYDVDGCELDPTCVWHDPGCADAGTPPALPQSGCFSATPCSSDADCWSGTCQEVMVAPKCDPGCEVCGESVFLCLP